MDNEAQIITNVEVDRVIPSANHIEALKGQDYYLESCIVINCAGLKSAELAQNKNFKYKFYKGIILTNNFKFDKLVYPIPELHGLGVHITVDLNNNVKFGPDVEEIFKEDFSVEPDRNMNFEKLLQNTLYHIEKLKLRPDYSGIRPKNIL